MRLFRSQAEEADTTLPVTAFLRHLEEARPGEAYKALKQVREGPDPPPHALWRLGRVLLERARPKHARLPLQMFVDLYPRHGDRPAVLRDLALALVRSGRVAEATAVAEEAGALRRPAPDPQPA